MPILAGITVIDSVAVTDIEALLAAIAPDRELHEPGKYFRKGTVELPCVDPLSDHANNVGAATWLVAALAVRMGRVEPVQDSGPVQEIMDQGIDRDQLYANLQPVGANVASADQDPRQRHGQHLVGNAINVAQWLNQVIGRLRQRSRIGLVI